MTIAPVAAAVERIAAYLETILGSGGSGVVSKVIRGWPEDDELLDLTSGPVISVTPGGEQRTDCPAKSLGSVTAAGVTTHTYRTATLNFTAQIDLWAPYRVNLDDIGPLVDNACSQSPPLPAILILLSTGYYNRRLVCHLGPGIADADGDSAKKGEWRMSWDLRVETDIVTTTTHVPQTQVDLLVTVDGGNSETIIAFEPA